MMNEDAKAAAHALVHTAVAAVGLHKTGLGDVIIKAAGKVGKHVSKTRNYRVAKVKVKRAASNVKYHVKKVVKKGINKVLNSYDGDTSRAGMILEVYDANDEPNNCLMFNIELFEDKTHDEVEVDLVNWSIEAKVEVPTEVELLDADGDGIIDVVAYYEDETLIEETLLKLEKYFMNKFPDIEDPVTLGCFGEYDLDSENEETPKKK